MIDVKKIGQFFTDKKLWDKPFNRWSKEEIEDLAEAFFSSPGPGVPRDGWKKPYILEKPGNDKGQKRYNFVIPFDSHPKFHWWRPGGMSIIETLQYIGAPEDMIEASRPIGYDPNGVKHS